MKKWWFILVGTLLLGLVIMGAYCLLGSRWAERSVEMVGGRISLPAARLDSPVSLEGTLQTRRSIRDYADEPLSLEEVSQLLWAAQGITDPRGHRTAPSAGALYPLEVYLLAGNVDGLKTGLYKYIPDGHELLEISSQDQRPDLHLAALKQDPVNKAPVVIVLAAVYERTSTKYGARAPQYVHIEVGSAAQNIYLQATALDLGTVFIGAFYDELVKAALHLAENEEPLGIMPVGRIP